jgi:hypothetical protein
VLNEALQYQERTGLGITHYLISYGYITEKNLARCLTEQFGFPYLPIRAYDIPDSVIALVPADVARKHYLMPIDRVKDVFTVVMANPLDTDAVEEIERITGCKVQLFVGILAEIVSAIEKYYHIVIQDAKPEKEKLAPLFVETKCYKGFDRRKTIRFETEMDISFYLQGLQNKAKIKDLSISGVLFQSENKIPLGTYLVLQVDLPKRFSTSPIAAVAQVVRRITLGHNKFDIGARLIKIPKEDAKVLAAYALANKTQ